MGYVTRDKLRAMIGQYRKGLLLYHLTICKDSFAADDMHKLCYFSSKQRSLPEDQANLSSCVEDTVIQLRKEVPLELVVKMFQKMVSTPISRGN